MFDQIHARLASAPGIVAAGAITSLPLSGEYEGGGLRPVGKVYENGQNPTAQTNVVSGDYFRATSIRLVAGRVFDASHDGPGRASMIVNRKFAREHYGSEADAVGREVQALFEFDPNRPPRVIVGVVDDVKSVSLDADIPPQVYVPHAQMPAFALRLIVRTSGPDPFAAVPSESATTLSKVRTRTSGCFRVDASSVIAAVRSQRDRWRHIRRSCCLRRGSPNLDPGASRVARGSPYGVGR